MSVIPDTNREMNAHAVLSFGGDITAVLSEDLELRLSKTPHPEYGIEGTRQFMPTPASVTSSGSQSRAVSAASAVSAPSIGASVSVSESSHGKKSSGSARNSSSQYAIDAAASLPSRVTSAIANQFGGIAQTSLFASDIGCVCVCLGGCGCIRVCACLCMVVCAFLCG